jgi:hypothetical protein
MTMPSYSVFSFTSREEHQKALYDACKLIVDTYNQTDMMDMVSYNDVSPYEFMNFARNVVNEIAA